LFQKKVVSIDGYERVPPYDEKALKKAAAGQPIAVAIEAGGKPFQHYVSVNDLFFRFFLCINMVSCVLFV
jgi:hypothetical protein